MSDVLSIARIADGVLLAHPIGTVGKADSAAGLDKPVQPRLYSSHQHNRKEPNMDHQPRLDDIQHILHCIADKDIPIQYDSDPTTNLITVADAVATLCWNIQSATQFSISPHPDSICAQDIYEEASKIAGLCLTELDNMRRGIKNAGITIVTDCADAVLSSEPPLSKLDMAIDSSERIKRLIEALGDAAPYWVHTDNLNETEIGYREETIAMLAYHATCAIIATNN